MDVFYMKLNLCCFFNKCNRYLAYYSLILHIVIFKKQKTKRIINQLHINTFTYQKKLRTFKTKTTNIYQCFFLGTNKAEYPTIYSCIFSILWFEVRFEISKVLIYTYVPFVTLTKRKNSKIQTCYAISKDTRKLEFPPYTVLARKFTV